MAMRSSLRLFPRLLVSLFLLSLSFSSSFLPSFSPSFPAFIFAVLSSMGGNTVKRKREGVMCMKGKKGGRYHLSTGPSLLFLCSSVSVLFASSSIK